MSEVSSDEIQKARRVALRGRSAKACTPCKDAKAKCSDYRPCGRCTRQNQEALCIDEACIFLIYPHKIDLLGFEPTLCNGSY